MESNKKNKPISRELLMEMYRLIITIRRFDEVGMEMYRQGYIRGYFHAYIGEEAIAVGACSALRTDDYIVSTHRGHGHCIAKGADVKRMMAELFGKATGYSRGRGGSMHIADRSTGNVGANGIVGGGIPLAVGVGMGIKQEHSDRVVICFFGDGAVNNGVLGESLNLASIYTLPVIFILENNFYAGTTHVSETAHPEKILSRADAYGVESVRVSGNDVLEVYSTVEKMVHRARTGGGPAFIEAVTYRHYGHHVNDPGTYMPSDTLAEWKAKDPKGMILQHMRDLKINETEIENINVHVEKAISEAVEFAKESPEPDIERFLGEIER